MTTSRMKEWLPAIGSIDVDASDDPVVARQSRIASWLQPQCIVLDSRASTVDQVITNGAAAIARRHGMVLANVHDALSRREQAASTAIGQGFAVPHARIPGIDEPLTLYLRSDAPVRFGAADGTTTSHFFFIVVPPDGAADDHLQLLAAFGRLVSIRRFRHRLEDVVDAAGVAEVFAASIPKVLRWVD